MHCDKKKKLPKKPFIITFDDGYEGQYTLIYPIIKKYNIKVTMFVVTDLVGKRTDMAKYFGWDEAREMQSSGLVDICSHGKRHIAYDTIPIIQFKHEILQSFLLLDKNIGYITTLKYSHILMALYNQDMADILKQNGIDIQVTGLGLNNLNTNDFSNINRLKYTNNMTRRANY
jgi:peptidoglycan/xylan/chitin deacetylase (PgdA/CDA1 family)